MLVAHVTYESWGGSFDHWLATTKAPTHPAGESITCVLWSGSGGSAEHGRHRGRPIMVDPYAYCRAYSYRGRSTTCPAAAAAQ